MPKRKRRGRQETKALRKLIQHRADRKRKLELESLEPRVLLTTLYGGDVFEYVAPDPNDPLGPGHTIRVSLQGNIIAEMIAVDLDDTGAPVVGDVPGLFMQSITGRTMTRVQGGRGGENGVSLLDGNGNGTPIFDPISFGGGSTITNNVDINVTALASRDASGSGETYGFNVPTIGSGQTLVQLSRMDNVNGDGSVVSTVHEATLGTDALSTLSSALPNVTALAIDRNTGQTYAVNERNGISELYRVNLQTGDVNFVGLMNLDPNRSQAINNTNAQGQITGPVIIDQRMIGLASDGAGIYYSLFDDDTVNNALFKSRGNGVDPLPDGSLPGGFQDLQPSNAANGDSGLNPTTPFNFLAVTVPATDDAFAYAINLNPSTQRNELYQISRAPDGSVQSFDFLGEIGSLVGVAPNERFDPVRRIRAMDITPDGVLYGVGYRDSDPGLLQLFTIDVAATDLDRDAQADEVLATTVTTLRDPVSGDLRINTLNTSAGISALSFDNEANQTDPTAVPKLFAIFNNGSQDRLYEIPYVKPDANTDPPPMINHGVTLADGAPTSIIGFDFNVVNGANSLIAIDLATLNVAGLAVDTSSPDQDIYILNTLGATIQLLRLDGGITGDGDVTTALGTLQVAGGGNIRSVSAMEYDSVNDRLLFIGVEDGGVNRLELFAISLAVPNPSGQAVSLGELREGPATFFTTPGFQVKGLAFNDIPGSPTFGTLYTSLENLTDSEDTEQLLAITPGAPGAAISVSSQRGEIGGSVDLRSGVVPQVDLRFVAMDAVNSVNPVVVAAGLQDVIFAVHRDDNGTPAVYTDDTNTLYRMNSRNTEGGPATPVGRMQVNIGGGLFTDIVGVEAITYEGRVDSVVGTQPNGNLWVIGAREDQMIANAATAPLILFKIDMATGTALSASTVLALGASIPLASGPVTAMTIGTVDAGRIWAVRRGTDNRDDFWRVGTGTGSGTIPGNLQGGTTNFDLTVGGVFTNILEWDFDANNKLLAINQDVNGRHLIKGSDNPSVTNPPGVGNYQFLTSPPISVGAPSSIPLTSITAPGTVSDNLVGFTVNAAITPGAARFYSVFDNGVDNETLFVSDIGAHSLVGGFDSLTLIPDKPIAVAEIVELGFDGQGRLIGVDQRQGGIKRLVELNIGTPTISSRLTQAGQISSDFKGFATDSQGIFYSIENDAGIKRLVSSPGTGAGPDNVFGNGDDNDAEIIPQVDFDEPFADIGRKLIEIPFSAARVPNAGAGVIVPDSVGRVSRDLHGFSSNGIGRFFSIWSGQGQGLYVGKANDTDPLIDRNTQNINAIRYNPVVSVNGDVGGDFNILDPSPTNNYNFTAFTVSSNSVDPVFYLEQDSVTGAFSIFRQIRNGTGGTSGQPTSVVQNMTVNGVQISGINALEVDNGGDLLFIGAAGNGGQQEIFRVETDPLAGNFGSVTSLGLLDDGRPVFDSIKAYALYPELNLLIGVRDVTQGPQSGRGDQLIAISITDADLPATTTRLTNLGKVEINGVPTNISALDFSIQREMIAINNVGAEKRLVRLVGTPLQGVAAMSFDNNSNLYIITQNYDGNSFGDLSGLPIDAQGATSPADVAAINLGNPQTAEITGRFLDTPNRLHHLVDGPTTRFELQNNFTAMAFQNIADPNPNGGFAATFGRLYAVADGTELFVVGNLAGSQVVAAAPGPAGTTISGPGSVSIDGIAFTINAQNELILVGIDNFDNNGSRLVEIGSPNPGASVAISTVNPNAGTVRAGDIGAFDLAGSGRPLLFAINGTQVIQGTASALPTTQAGATAATAINGADFNPADGLLYFISDSNAGADQLYSLDVSLGNATLIQNSLVHRGDIRLQNVNVDGLRSLAFDPNNGALLGIRNTGQLLTITPGPAGGVANSLNDFNLVRLGGAAVTDITGIEFIPGDTNQIYAVRNAGQGSQIIRIRHDNGRNSANTSYVLGTLSDPDDPDFVLRGPGPIRGESLESLTWNPTLFNPLTGQFGALISTDSASDEMVIVDHRPRFPTADAFAIFVTQSDAQASITAALVNDRQFQTPIGPNLISQELLHPNSQFNRNAMQPFTSGEPPIQLLVSDAQPPYPLIIVSADADAGRALLGARSETAGNVFRPIIQATATSAIGTRAIGLDDLPNIPNLIRPANLSAGLVIAESLLNYVIQTPTLATKMLGGNIDNVQALSVSRNQIVIGIDTDHVDALGNAIQGDELSRITPAGASLGSVIVTDATLGSQIRGVQALDFGDADLRANTGDPILGTGENLYAIYAIDNQVPLDRGVAFNLGNLNIHGVAVAPGGDAYGLNLNFGADGVEGTVDDFYELYRFDRDELGQVIDVTNLGTIDDATGSRIRGIADIEARTDAGERLLLVGYNYDRPVPSTSMGGASSFISPDGNILGLTVDGQGDIFGIEDIAGLQIVSVTRDIDGRPTGSTRQPIVSGANPLTSIRGLDAQTGTDTLFAIGVDATLGADRYRLYTINPATGAATEIFAPTAAILLETLNNGRGVAVDPLQADFQVRTRNNVIFSVDLDVNDITLQDVINAINTAPGNATVVASLDVGGHSINLTDTFAGAATAVFQVTALNGTAAIDLGILKIGANLADTILEGNNVIDGIGVPATAANIIKSVSFDPANPAQILAILDNGFGDELLRIDTVTGQILNEADDRQILVGSRRTLVTDMDFNASGQLLAFDRFGGPSQGRMIQIDPNNPSFSTEVTVAGAIDRFLSGYTIDATTGRGMSVLPTPVAGASVGGATPFAGLTSVRDLVTDTRTDTLYAVVENAGVLQLSSVTRAADGSVVGFGVTNNITVVGSGAAVTTIEGIDVDPVSGDFYAVGRNAAGGNNLRLFRVATNGQATDLGVIDANPNTPNDQPLVGTVQAVSFNPLVTNGNIDRSLHLLLNNNGQDRLLRVNFTNNPVDPVVISNTVITVNGNNTAITDWEFTANGELMAMGQVLDPLVAPDPRVLIRVVVGATNQSSVVPNIGVNPDIVGMTYDSNGRLYSVNPLTGELWVNGLELRINANELYEIDPIQSELTARSLTRLIENDPGTGLGASVDSIEAIAMNPIDNSINIIWRDNPGDLVDRLGAINLATGVIANIGLNGGAISIDGAAATATNIIGMDFTPDGVLLAVDDPAGPNNARVVRLNLVDASTSTTVPTPGSQVLDGMRGYSSGTDGLFVGVSDVLVGQDRLMTGRLGQPMLGSIDIATGQFTRIEFLPEAVDAVAAMAFAPEANPLTGRQRLFLTTIDDQNTPNDPTDDRYILSEVRYAVNANGLIVSQTPGAPMIFNPLGVIIDSSPTAPATDPVTGPPRLVINSMDFDGAGRLLAHDLNNGRLVDLNYRSPVLQAITPGALFDMVRGGAVTATTAGSLRPTVGGISFDFTGARFLAVDNSTSAKPLIEDPDYLAQYNLELTLILGSAESVSIESAMLMTLQGTDSAAAVGQSIGDFFWAGAVTGKVNITGSVNNFYTGWLVTGQTLGGVERALQPNVGDPALGTDNNFRIGGDIRSLVVLDAIGTNDGSLFPAPQYWTGFELDAGGKVGLITTRDSFGGQIEIFNRNDVDGANTLPAAFQELEVKGTFPNTPFQLLTFNDNFESAQRVGSIRATSANEPDTLSIQGNLQRSPDATIDDPNDYYAVSLTVGQVVTVQVLGDVRVALFDPDGRQVASDYDNMLQVLVAGTPFQFRADRAGEWRIAVGTPGDENFNFAPGTAPFIGGPYQITVTGVEDIALGGVVTGRFIWNSGVLASTNLIRVHNGDVGTLTTRQSLLNVTTGAVFSNDPLSIMIDDGNLRSVNTDQIALVIDVNRIDPTNGNIGMLRSTLNTSVAIDARGSMDMIDVRGILRFPGVPTVPLTGIRLGGGLGVMRAANVLDDQGAGLLVVNDDGSADRDGIIDLIDISGDFVNVDIFTGPRFATTNPGDSRLGEGGNVRYMRVQGNLVHNTAFNGSTPVRVLWDPNQPATLYDDGGGQIIITPTRMGGEEVDANGALIEQDPFLFTRSYPIASGGVVLVDVVTSGSIEIKGNSLKIGQPLEIGRITSTSQNTRSVVVDNDNNLRLDTNVNEPLPPASNTTPGGTTGGGTTDPDDPLTEIILVPILLVDETTGIPQVVFVPIEVPVDPPPVDPNTTGTATPQIFKRPDTIVSIRGDAKIDVFEITGQNFTAIGNNTGGEIVNIFAANVGDIVSHGNVGVGLTREGGALAASPPAAQAIPNLYPFRLPETGLNISGNLLTLRADGAVGNVNIGGRIGRLGANSDGVDNPDVFEGLVGNIVSVGEIEAINIGEGLLYSGSGDVSFAGIYTSGLIRTISNQGQGLNSDIRGDIVATVGIREIRLINGSIINAEIKQDQVFENARESRGGANPPVQNDSVASPILDIGSVRLSGHGGIIGSQFVANDIGEIRVVGGFGIINSVVATIATMGNTTADGFGIRFTNFAGGSIQGDIIATGHGALLSVLDYSESVRLSERLTPGSPNGLFDPFFGRLPNFMTDLHTFFGTSVQQIGDPNDPNAIPAGALPGVTEAGVIEDTFANGQLNLGNVQAYQIRGRLSEQTVFNFGNQIRSIRTDSDINGLAVTTGSLATFLPGNDVSNLDLVVSGLIRTIRINGDLVGGSTIRTLGFNGNIQSINIAGNFDGGISSSGTIGTIIIGGDMNGDLVVTGGDSRTLALGSLRLGGSLSDGSFDIQGNVGSIDVAGSLGDPDNLLIEDVLHISGNLNTLRVGTDRRVNGSSLGLRVFVDGNLNTLDVTGAIANTITVAGNLRTLTINSDSLTRGTTLLDADVNVGGDLSTATINGGSFAGSINVGKNLGTLRMTGGSILSGSLITSALGSINSISITEGDLAGSIQARNGAINTVTLSSRTGLGNMTGTASLIASSVRNINIAGGMTGVSAIDVQNDLGMLTVGGATAIGTRIDAGSSRTIRIGTDFMGRLDVDSGGVAGTSVTIGRMFDGIASLGGNARFTVGDAFGQIGGLAASLSVGDNLTNFSTRGDFSGDLIVGGKLTTLSAGSVTGAVIVTGHELTTFRTAGAVTNSLIQVGQDAGRDGVLGTGDVGEHARLAKLGTFNAGSVSNSIIASGGDINTITLGAAGADNSSFSAGFSVGGAAITAVIGDASPLTPDADPTLDELNIARSLMSRSTLAGNIRTANLRTISGNTSITAGADPGDDGIFDNTVGTPNSTTILSSLTGGNSSIGTVTGTRTGGAVMIIADVLGNTFRNNTVGGVLTHEVTYTIDDLAPPPVINAIGTATQAADAVFNALNGSSLRVSLRGPGAAELREVGGQGVDNILDAIILTGATRATTLTITTVGGSAVSIGRILSEDGATVGTITYDGRIVGDSNPGTVDLMLDGAVNTFNLGSTSEDPGFTGRIGGSVNQMTIGAMGPGSLLLGGDLSRLTVRGSLGDSTLATLSRTFDYSSMSAHVTDLDTRSDGALFVFDAATGLAQINVNVPPAALPFPVVSQTTITNGLNGTPIVPTAIDFDLNTGIAERLLAIAETIAQIPDVSIGGLASTPITLSGLAVTSARNELTGLIVDTVFAVEEPNFLPYGNLLPDPVGQDIAIRGMTQALDGTLYAVVTDLNAGVPALELRRFNRLADGSIDPVNSYLSLGQITHLEGGLTALIDNVFALETHPVTGDLFVIGTSALNIGNQIIFRLDPNPRDLDNDFVFDEVEAIQVATTGLVGNATGLAFQPDGLSLYAAVNEELLVINPTTGASTSRGLIQINAGNATIHGMDFAQSGGGASLVALHDPAGPGNAQRIIIDLTDPNNSLALNEPGATDSPIPDDLQGFSINSNGAMFTVDPAAGPNGRVLFSSTTFDRLVTLNTATGVVSTVGQISGVSSSNPYVNGIEQLAADDNGNLFAIVNDFDGSGSAFTRDDGLVLVRLSTVATNGLVRAFSPDTTLPILTASSLPGTFITGSLVPTTPLDSLNDGAGVNIFDPGDDFAITATDGTVINVDLLLGIDSVQDVLDSINNAPGNGGLVVATVTGGVIQLQDNAGGGGQLGVAALNASAAAADLGILQVAAPGVTTIVGTGISEPDTFKGIAVDSNGVMFAIHTVAGSDVDNLFVINTATGAMTPADNASGVIQVNLGGGFVDTNIISFGFNEYGQIVGYNLDDDGGAEMLLIDPINPGNSQLGTAVTNTGGALTGTLNPGIDFFALSRTFDTVIGGGRLTAFTPLATLNDGAGVTFNALLNDFQITQRDGAIFNVDITAATLTVGDVLNAINTAPGNTSVTAQINTSGTGIDLIDGFGGAPVATLAVTALNASTAATSLGILQTGDSLADITIEGRVIGGPQVANVVPFNAYAIDSASFVANANNTFGTFFSSPTVLAPLGESLAPRNLVGSIIPGGGVGAGVNLIDVAVLSDLFTRRDQIFGIHRDDNGTPAILEDDFYTLGELVRRGPQGQVSQFRVVGAIADNLTAGTNLASEGVRIHTTLSDFRISLRSGATFDVDLLAADTTVANLLTRINNAPGNAGQLTAAINAAGTGIDLTDNSVAVPGNILTVTALNGSTAAADVGILHAGVNDADVTIEGDPIANLHDIQAFETSAGSVFSIIASRFDRPEAPKQVFEFSAAITDVTPRGVLRLNNANVTDDIVALSINTATDSIMAVRQLPNGVEQLLEVGRLTGNVINRGNININGLPSNIVGLDFDSANQRLLAIDAQPTGSRMASLNVFNPTLSTALTSVGSVNPDLVGLSTDARGHVFGVFSDSQGNLDDQLWSSPELGRSAVLGTIDTGSGRFLPIANLKQDGVGTVLRSAATAMAVDNAVGNNDLVITTAAGRLLRYESANGAFVENHGILRDPITATTLAISALEYNDATGQLLALDSALNQLVQITPNNGLGTAFIAPILESGSIESSTLHGLSYDPINDRLLGFQNQTPVSSSNLVSISGDDLDDRGLRANKITTLTIDTDVRFTGRIASSTDISNVNVTGNFGGTIFAAADINSYNQRGGDFDGTLHAHNIRTVTINGGGILVDGIVEAENQLSTLTLNGGEFRGTISAHDANSLTLNGNATDTARIFSSGKINNLRINGGFGAQALVNDVRTFNISGLMGATSLIDSTGNVDMLTVGLGTSAGAVIDVGGATRTLTIGDVHRGVASIRNGVQTVKIGEMNRGLLAIGADASSINIAGRMIDSVISLGAWIGNDRIYNTQDDRIFGGSVRSITIGGDYRDSAIVAGVLPPTSAPVLANTPNLPANNGFYIGFVSTTTGGARTFVDAAEAGGILPSQIGSINIQGRVLTSNIAAGRQPVFAAADAIGTIKAVQFSGLPSASQRVYEDPFGPPQVASITNISTDTMQVIFNEPVSSASLILSVDTNNNGSLNDAQDIRGTVTLFDRVSGTYIDDVDIIYTNFSSLSQPDFNNPNDPSFITNPSNPNYIHAGTEATVQGAMRLVRRLTAGATNPSFDGMSIELTLSGSLTSAAIYDRSGGRSLFRDFDRTGDGTSLEAAFGGAAVTATNNDPFGTILDGDKNSIEGSNVTNVVSFDDQPDVFNQPPLDDVPPGAIQTPAIRFEINRTTIVSGSFIGANDVDIFRFSADAFRFMSFEFIGEVPAEFAIFMRDDQGTRVATPALPDPTVDDTFEILARPESNVDPVTGRLLPRTIPLMQAMEMPAAELGPLDGLQVAANALLIDDVNMDGLDDSHPGFQTRNVEYFIVVRPFNNVFDPTKNNNYSLNVTYAANDDMLDGRLDGALVLPGDEQLGYISNQAIARNLPGGNNILLPGGGNQPRQLVYLNFDGGIDVDTPAQGIAISPFDPALLDPAFLPIVNLKSRLINGDTINGQLLTGILDNLITIYTTTALSKAPVQPNATNTLNVEVLRTADDFINEYEAPGAQGIFFTRINPALLGYDSQTEFTTILVGQTIFPNPPLGISPAIDYMNLNKGGGSTVFTNAFTGLSFNTDLVGRLNDYSTALANVIAQELNHNLGLPNTIDVLYDVVDPLVPVNHPFPDDPDNNPLTPDDSNAALFATMSSNFNLAPDGTLLPRRLGTTLLEPTLFPVGDEDSVDLLLRWLS